MEATVPPIVVEHNPSASVPEAGDDHDWLRPLIVQLIRASGLLQPDQPAPGHGGSLSEGFALAEVAGTAPLAQRDLAERLGLEKSTVSRLLAGLERNPANRRFYQLRLTGRGRAAAAALAAAHRRRHLELLAAMTPAEREALAVGLRALVRALHAQPWTHGEPSELH